MSFVSIVCCITSASKGKKWTRLWNMIKTPVLQYSSEKIGGSSVMMAFSLLESTVFV